jgi:hypothetical protein
VYNTTFTVPLLEVLPTIQAWLHKSINLSPISKKKVVVCYKCAQLKLYTYIQRSGVGTTIKTTQSLILTKHWFKLSLIDQDSPLLPSTKAGDYSSAQVAIQSLNIAKDTWQQSLDC